MTSRSNEDRKRRYHRWTVIGGLVILVATFIGIEVYIQQSSATPAPVSNTVLLHAITALNLVLLLILLFVLGRNLIKLYVERRRKELGSKFRTKLVVTYIGLALIPSIFLFLVASDLIQKSIDRWFSTDVEEVTMRSRQLVRETLRLQEDQLLHLADSLSAQVTEGRMLNVDSWQYLRNRMKDRLDEMQLDAIYVFSGPRLLIDPVVAEGSRLEGRLGTTDSLAAAARAAQTAATEAPTEATGAGTGPGDPGSGGSGVGAETTAGALGASGDRPGGEPAAGFGAVGERLGEPGPAAGDRTGGGVGADEDSIGGALAGSEVGAHEDSNGGAPAGSEEPVDRTAVASGATGAGARGPESGDETRTEIPGGGAIPEPGTPEVAGSGTDMLPTAQVRLALAGHPFRLRDRLPDDRLVVHTGVPIRSPSGQEVVGLLAVARVLDADLTRQADTIETLYRSYMEGAAQKEPIKTNYLLTFLLLTLLILFSMVWVGLYLAKGVTVPIQKLAEGTRAVAAGNLDYRVDVEARDELGTLVTSFNQMTEDLKASQEDLETSRDHLERTITELEERRSYMEAVLANIATGVISMNADGRITTFNHAAQRMLCVEGEELVGERYADVLGTTALDPLRRLMERGRATRPPVEEELVVEAGGRRLTLAAHCSTLRGSDGEHLGTVVVLDDLTELIKAQKAAAWREVARRIAHEIRNPLTPIQLSAQRIARRYRKVAGAETEYTVIEDGTQTILQEVATLKDLVEEFSRFARMPSARPVPTDINRVIESSLPPYASMHEGVTVEHHLADDLPELEVDPDQLRRAFTNLFDNAVEAMDGHGRLEVDTRYEPELEVVRVEVADTGPGIDPADKDRLFLPYFSRKEDGTGLGLAIVHQIVSDHRGYVRVVDNHPRGTVFIVELPR